jgi:hypothetical protein
VLELFEMLSRRVNAVLALGTALTTFSRVQPKAKFSHPISRGRNFPALRFGYSVMSNQFSIDWRGATGACSVTRTGFCVGLHKLAT